MLDACQRLGVETNPSVIDCLAIIPLFSWYHESFDREKDITGIRIPSLELACKDFRACKWPEGLINGDNSLATHFDAMNDKNQDTVQEMIASCLQIISFSHFVPRLELCPEKRMLFYPNLPKMIGSDFLEARIRYIHGARGNTNACHIFGHTHFCWDVLLDGIRYVQAPLAYPRERKRRMNGGEEWLPFCIYSKVLGDASNSVRRSNTQCRWRSFAATVPADSAADRRKQKRVSMEERIAMVEGFVNKYRATNGGKFPSTKAAMKEVGGSYYTVKKIVQEMQYNANMPVDKDTVVKESSARNAAIRKENLVSKVEETLSSATSLEHEECEDGQLTNEILLDKEYNQNWKSSHELKQIPSDRQTIDGGISQETQSLTISGVEGGDTSSNREAEAKLQTPIAAKQTLLQEMSRISGSDNNDAAAQVFESKVKSFSRSEEPDNNIKQKDSPVEVFKFDGLKKMDEQRHSPEPDKPTRELSNERKADTQAESKPSMWKNMKSFADGILNMWWKQ